MQENCFTALIALESHETGFSGLFFIQKFPYTIVYLPSIHCSYKQIMGNQNLYLRLVMKSVEQLMNLEFPHNELEESL